MPDALVPVVIVVAILAIVRGDASMRDVVRIARTVMIVAAVGLTILYVPTWLYEFALDRDAPTWLTIATTVPVLILVFTTPFMLTTPQTTTANRRGSSQDT